MNKTYTYLALGDSYTIGEAVLLHKNFPYQAVQQLREKGVRFLAPEIIAKTGWTTDELQAGMQGYRFLPSYDLVTLLIGVNNQYRGRSSEEYRGHFEKLLQEAIRLAGGNAQKVYVFSIPDYSATPFAETMDRSKISRELDAYNAIAQKLAQYYQVSFIDITEGSRDAKQDLELVASDKLHPSEKEYEKWAAKLVESFMKGLN